MEASVAEFKLMIGSAGVSDQALALALSDAKAAVLNDGVGINHADFGQLQRYKAAHLLTSWGQLNTAIASETVGDVSRTFSSSSSSSGSLESYQQKYRTLLIGVIGLKHKVA